MQLTSQSLASKWAYAHAARTSSAMVLAELLCASRARTLALADAYAAALGDRLVVPYNTQLNPPLWELGHIGWFQEFWLARNPQRGLGHRADPNGPRSASLLPPADALYNSSRVAHASRWQLPLPDLTATKRYLSDTLASTLALLAHSPQDDAALYFYRLALFHEDMHSEAAVYMAQAMGLALPAALITHERAAGAAPVPGMSPATLKLPDTDWLLGYAYNQGDAQCDTATGNALPGAVAPGFAFDNELGPHSVSVQACEIDASPVTWRRYLPFVAAGGYAQASFWSEPGWQWLQSGQGAGLSAPTQLAPAQLCPRYLRPAGLHQPEHDWLVCRFGQWQALDLDAPACHLSFFEAEAWCQWAGRQLPTEAQWEYAAMTQPGFDWGTVWEWTASAFKPYPGFEPHPYVDYSAPWFGSRPVLRGASWATSPRMAHPRYRNYFTPERNDLYAGFRSCSPG